MGLILLYIVSRWSLGVFADPIAQGATVKYSSSGGWTFALILSGRAGERNYVSWNTLDDTSYTSYDTVGQFHWAKGEFRVEYPFGVKKGIRPYVTFGVGGTSEKAWVFNEDSLFWESYQYKTLGGIGGVGLYIYPFSFLKGLFEESSRLRRKATDIEDDFTLQIELLNLYYRKLIGGRPWTRDYFYEYNYAGVGMGIGFYYNF